MKFSVVSRLVCVWVHVLCVSHGLSWSLIVSLHRRDATHPLSISRPLNLRCTTKQPHQAHSFKNAATRFSHDTLTLSVTHISFPAQMQSQFISSGKGAERSTLINYFCALSKLLSPTREVPRSKRSGPWGRSALCAQGELTERVIIVFVIVILGKISTCVTSPMTVMCQSKGSEDCSTRRRVNIVRHAHNRPWM